MVNRLHQTTFSPADFTSSRLNWHTRPGRVANRLVIFIHGLGGKGYKTWREFPAIIFNDYSIDVAIFDYASFTRRIRIPPPGSSVQTYVDMLAERMCELEESYESIYLMAHSLGGVMAECAVTQYLEDKRLDAPSQLKPICGIILFASPRAGAALALPVVRKLFPEGKWLFRGSDSSKRSDRYFSTNIDSDVRANVSDQSGHETAHKIFIPRYVCVGAKDRVVDRFSAENSIPGPQRHIIDANHRSIVKPTKLNPEDAEWVNDTIAKIEARRQKIRERQHASKRRIQAAPSPADIIVTEFWASGPSADEWQTVYNDVRDSANFPDPEVHDSRDVPDVEASLLISLADSDLVMSDGATQKATVSRAVARKEANYALTVGLSAVGERSADATKMIEQWLQEKGWPPHISVNEAADIDTLRSVIYTWIYNIVHRHPRSAKSRMHQIERQIRADINSIDPMIGG